MNSVSYEDVKTIVMKALDDFQQNDLQLLELCVDERAATHRIACYLQKCFEDMDVDCEYNRKGAGRKPTPVPNSRGRVKPDIIVHKRNTEENLLCIEAKKKGVSRQKNVGEDRERLKGFTSPYGEYRYKFGLLLILNLKVPYDIECEWFCDGETKSDE